ncbi:MAG TPA: HutD family protein [Polyangiaceae bacterium]
MSQSVKIPGAAGKAPRFVRRSEWTTQPWKNGKGVTHEVLRWSRPGQGAAADSTSFDLRVSVAEIEGAQPFSLFPGIERVLVPLEDNDLVLAIYALEEPMTKHRILRFSGEVPAATKGTGRASDLNVMWPRGRDVRVELAAIESTVDSRKLVVFALAPTRIETARGTIDMDTHDTWLASDERAPRASVPVVWIRY